MQTPTEIGGKVETYTDITGRTQTAVTGPNGHYLITRKNDRDPYTVWRSDSLRTTATTGDAGYAMQVALKVAGVIQ